MRNFLFLIAVALGLCGSAWLTLRADSHHLDVSVTTTRSDVSVTVSDGVAAIAGEKRAFPRFSTLTDPGKPALPFRIVNVVLPPGRRFEAVTAGEGAPLTLAEDVTVKLASAPKGDPDAGIPAAVGLAAPLISGGPGEVFPGASVRYLGSGSWHGQTIASFAVFPVRVDGARLVLHEHISLRIETAIANTTPAVRAQRASENVLASVRRELQSTVVNPADARGYTPIATSAQRGPFKPSSVPSLEGSPVDHVIITTATLAAPFDSLAAWRTASGVPTVVKTVEWIDANYRQGTDLAESIRFFLTDAYEKWGTRFVLIGGDTAEIPPRYFYSTYYYGGTNLPCDHYFAGLDGDFNADHDARFGEQPDDVPDLYPELAVGRIPVSTVAAAQVVVDKIRGYETPVDAEYTDKVLQLAEVLFPSPWSPGQTILSNGAELIQYLHTLYINDPARRATRAFETEWLYPGSVHESRQNTIDSLNAGFNQVFHIGHGYRFNMHCGDENVAIPDADALYNPDRWFNLYMLNCTAGAFDYDCLAEHMLRNANGGAVSVVGATNSTFADVSAYYMEDYVVELYEMDNTRVGETVIGSRVPRTPIAELGDNADLWTHYIYTLLGDPAMRLWTKGVASPAVSHVAGVNSGVNGITVQVLVGGLPLPATVCVWKDGEDYQVMNTDGSGNAAFTLNTPTAGTIRVVATGRNMARYEGFITVAPATGAMPTVELLFVDDDNVAGTQGNGDGQIDAGETIDLTPAVRNEGGTATPTLTGTLSIADANVTVIDPTVAVPGIGPGGLAASSDPWRVHIHELTPDAWPLAFQGVLANGPSSWTTPLTRVAHAPRLELVGLRKSDEAPVGNGNGVITNGEQFLLFATLKNYGTGRADGLTATLSALDAGSTVIDSVASFAGLTPLASGENLAGFRLSEANVAIANALRIVVTDSHGRTLVHDAELREPLAPTLQSFDASLGVDRIGVTWAAGASADVGGYNIYRATAPAGPYVRANSDIITHSVFTDIGLAPSTRYYYAVASVDQSGNEGPQSAVQFASTNPPQLEGWPLELVDPSATSPAVGDIDGYGALEIVVGNNRMYAWHSDGEEVVDGDLQGITWGVLSPEGVDFVGPAALADLDGSPGFEIASAAYTSKQVFCFQGDGTVMPGWPRATVDLVRAGVVIGDIDGDDDPEIVAVDQEAYLYAWHANGTEVIDGDANPATQGVFKRLPDTSQWQYQMPALADLDNDGKEEIIIATQDMKVYVLNETAGNEPGWPFALPSYAGGGVAVGDLDDNGDLEIVVTVRSTGHVYALNHNGTQLWLTFVNNNLFFNPSPALADLTGDGKLETIIPSSNRRLYVFKHDGTAAPGWPVFYSPTTYTESSPVIADVDGDASPDVLLGDEGRFINAWSSTGVLLDGFPLVMKDSVRGTPAVTDIDKNGLVDIIAVGYDKTVYAWALSTPYNPEASPWPMYRGNVLRNGRHGTFVPTGTGDTPTRVYTTRLQQNYPNPFNPTTQIPYEVENGAKGRVTLTVYDVRGARVRTLVDESARPGVYSVVWDGRDGHGNAVGSGVYFYRLSTPTRAMTRKMVLLK